MREIHLEGLVVSETVGDVTYGDILCEETSILLTDLLYDKELIGKRVKVIVKELPKHQIEIKNNDINCNDLIDEIQGKIDQAYVDANFDAIQYLEALVEHVEAISKD